MTVNQQPPPGYCTRGEAEKELGVVSSTLHYFVDAKRIKRIPAEGLKNIGWYSIDDVQRVKKERLDEAVAKELLKAQRANEVREKKTSKAKQSRDRSKGERADQAYQLVMSQPWNVFGQQVLTRIRERSLSMATIVKRIGMHVHLDSFYYLIMDTQKSTFVDLQFIFRLANILDFDVVQLLAWFFASNRKYYSVDWRGDTYQMKEFDTENLARIIAAFVTIFDTLVHSPAFQAANQEQQGKLAMDIAGVVANMLIMSDNDRQAVIALSNRLSPPVSKTNIDPRIRHAEIKRVIG